MNDPGADLLQGRFFATDDRSRSSKEGLGVVGIRLRRLWWLIPVAMPVLFYAGLIAFAYIRPPLDIASLSTGYMPQPAAIVHVENKGRWPVTLLGTAVSGVLPPDEDGALVTRGGEIPTVHTLIHPDNITATGALSGWQIQPKDQSVHHGIKLVWYQAADLRWMHCPVVRYRYLGWPMEVRGFCRETLRGAALSGSVPRDLGEWGPWQSLAGGVRFRTQRVTQNRDETLWIEMEPDEGAPQVALTVNRFLEEPAGGHARFRIRVVTLEPQPGRTVHFSIPLRWGEPDPELAIEVIPVSELR